jgi:hypothetical protein
MKKLFVLVACCAVVLMLSKMSVAQSNEDAPGHARSQLSVEKVVAEAGAPQVLPFGYPPYPTVGGYPAYGIPYSYPRDLRTARTPRAPRRLAARLTPQPYPLPTPGAVPGAASPFVPPMVAPPMVMGQVPPQQETLGAIPPAPSSEQPTVFHRPTPIRNFVTLMAAPRPYIGYDPYAGYPPFQGYIPPQ